MAYRFKRGESVAEGFHRIAGEQFAGLLDELRKPGGPDAHASRKHCKAIRALLRLMRGALAKESRQRLQHELRDVARALAWARDSQVRLQTFDALIGQTALGAARRFATLRSRLAADSKRALAQPLGEEEVEAVIARAESARNDTIALRLRAKGWDAIIPGLRRAYREGRAAFADATASGLPAARHYWRTRAKELGHIVLLLEAMRPGKLARLQRELDALCELLGDEHDLFVLEEYIHKRGTSPGVAAEQSELGAFIQARSADIRNVADELGASVYCEKPRAFCRRMEDWWHAWRHADES